MQPVDSNPTGCFILADWGNAVQAEQTTFSTKMLDLMQIVKHNVQYEPPIH
jgi:hypothetical protein